MQIIVIGLGSMGKRRIRLIRELHPDYTIIGVDGREDRREEACNLYDIDGYESISEAYKIVSQKLTYRVDAEDKTDTYICAFVCTSPLSHANIINECLILGMHVFTELNLVPDRYEENIQLAKEKGLTLFLSSTFLYREEIKYIKQYVGDIPKWNYIYHIGQYLPDWHPWENYKDFFIGDKRTNGCREIMAIELPWLLNTFGEITNCTTCADKITKLNIDYKDNYIIQFTHENGNKGVLIVDVVSPYAIRRLEAYTEGKYITWSGTPESLMEFDAENASLKKVQLNEEIEHIDGYKAFVAENAYKNEIIEFFDVIGRDKKTRYGFKSDALILEIINHIENENRDAH